MDDFINACLAQARDFALVASLTPQIAQLLAELDKDQLATAICLKAGAPDCFRPVAVLRDTLVREFHETFTALSC